MPTPTHSNPMPAMTVEERAALKQSIERHGFLPEFPVVLDQRGDVLDGHHRAAVAAEIGVEPVTVQKNPMTAEKRRAYILDIHLGRRHLTAEQNRALISGELLADPKASNVAIARMTGVSDKTVAVQRAKLEATSEIPRLVATGGTDKDGKGIATGKPVVDRQAEKRRTDKEIITAMAVFAKSWERWTERLFDALAADVDISGVDPGTVRDTIGADLDARVAKMRERVLSGLSE